MAGLHRLQGFQGPAEAFAVQDDAAFQEGVHDIGRFHPRPDKELVGPAEIRHLAVIESMVQRGGDTDDDSDEDGQEDEQSLLLPGLYRFFHSFLSLGSGRRISSSPSLGW